MTTPTTQAGKALLADLTSADPDTPSPYPDLPDRILAIEREAVDAAAQGYRLIRASENLLDDFGGRSIDGSLITAEWGEPDKYGVYEPVFSVHYDDNIVKAAVAPYAAVVAAAQTVADTPVYANDRDGLMSHAYAEALIALDAALAALDREPQP